jgi:hypothetical protein
MSGTNSDFDDKEGGAQAQADVYVKQTTDNDVLCGRGGSINSHPGNERFRMLVEKRKRVYLTARFKREKRLIASSIVAEIRALNPPGRFLARDGKKANLWKEITEEKARDKTSQSLREGAPGIRAEIEIEINEHHAEQQRVEVDDEASGRPAHQAPYPAYSSQGWGYPSFYGGPPAPYGHPPPPPYSGYWGAAYPHGMVHPSPYTQATTSSAYPTPPKSALEQTADFVVSGADSFMQWTQKSLSFGGPVHTMNSTDGQDSLSRADTAGSKPIVYVHEDGTKKRRMVKFREDQSFSSRRRPTKRHNANASLTGNSLVDGEDDLEPHELGASDNTSTGLMNTFANTFLSSFGSWDAASILCGQDNSDERVPFPHSSDPVDEMDGMEHVPDEEMMVEWEGQEVQLMDNRIGGESCREDIPVPAPPLPTRRNSAYDQTSSVGLSSLGSCHSWLPEQINATASYFGGGGGSRGEDSMDMDYSAGGTENLSAAGSLGGGSLTRVFEHETLDDGLQSPHMTHQALQTMPSWERHWRSRSPSSNDDDESLISKSSSKLSDTGIALFPATTATDTPMRWGSRV